MDDQRIAGYIRMAGVLAQTDATSDDPGRVGDMPDVFADWHRAVLDFAHSTPPVAHGIAAVLTEAGVVLLGGLILLNLWRTRGLDSRTRASALLVLPATVLAYLVSEMAKAIITAPRPCHALTDVAPLTQCPPLGDWSFPSNHATISGAAATALLISWRHWPGALAVLLGALTAFTRVFLGVHYPHDVIAGFLLGAVVTTIVVRVAARQVAVLVVRLREQRTLDDQPTVELSTVGRSAWTTPLPRMTPAGRVDNDEPLPTQLHRQPIARERPKPDEEASTQQIPRPRWTRR